MKRPRDDDADQHKNKKPLVLYSRELESSQQFNKPRIVDTRLSRLCNLPDDVLQTILSYLPTKETIRTCILSRRWRYLWKSVPVLDFPHWNNRPGNHNRFKKLVNKVCDLHARVPLERFHLKYAMLEQSDVDLLNEWINYAITKRGVKNFDFRIYHEYYYRYFPEQLPHCLFSSEALVELKLSLEGHTLNLPSIISLPKLKVVHLERVNLAKIQNLVDSAPSLEALHLTECMWIDVEFVTVSSLHLRELEIIENLQYTDDMPAVSVNCPSLEKLTYQGELVNEVRLCGPTKNLNAATIDLMMPKSPIINLIMPEFLENMFKLLYSVAAVKTLTFYVKSNKGLDCLQKEEYLETFPVFENLVELKWSIISTNGRTEQTMLNKCPCLERMEFMLGKATYEYERLSSLYSNMPGYKYFRTHLKKVTIKTKFSYLRRDEEFKSVAFLLRESSVLEQLVIVLPKRLTVPKPAQAVAEQLLNMVSKFDKASTSCRISVVYYVGKNDIILTC